MINTKDKGHQIVYNLYPVEGLNIFLPTAIICELNSDEKLGYWRAAALHQNVESYNITIDNTAHVELLNLCQDLSITSIEASLNRKNKKPKALSQLFSDPDLQKTIQHSIDKRMARFLEKVRENQYPICFDLKRKVKAEDVRMFFFNGTAEPKMHFTKTQTGIRYNLSLKVGNQNLKPHSFDIKLICNFPGIIAIKNQLIWLNDINSIKLKPFLTKESVFIPEKLVRDYFEQFILDVMGKIDIQVDGFELTQSDEIELPILNLIHNIFLDQYVLELSFQYQNTIFKYNEVNQRKTKISFREDGQIAVYQTQRNNDAEEGFAKYLEGLGLEKTEALFFIHGNNKYDAINLLSQNLREIKKVFQLNIPEMEGRKITLSTIDVYPDFELIGDWFDLKGVICIDNQVYSMSELFQNIKSDNLYFKLRDGTYFILPEEIITRFEKLASFSKSDINGWRLSKQHFTLMESEIESSAFSNLKIYGEEDVEYTPTTKLQAILRPYQLDGVKWLIKHRLNNLGACLADDMGLGKTLQTLAALLDAKENMTLDTDNMLQPKQLDLFGTSHDISRKSLNALVILPASLIFNWYQEIKKYVPSFQVLVFIGAQRKKAEKTISTFDIILTSYQTAVTDIEILNKVDFNYIVLDESQYIRNNNSKTFKAIRTINSKHKISLSGTPIENSLADLWTQMEFINPEILGNYPFFKNNFQIPIEKDRDENAIADLKTLVDPFILRRTKEQAAPDLPELIEIDHYSEMSKEQKKVFEKEKSAARNYLLGLHESGVETRFHVLASLTKLRQIANHPVLAFDDYIADSGKFQDVISQIETIVKSNFKVLIFSSFKSHLSLFEAWCRDMSISFLTLTGDTPVEKRAGIVAEFQNNKSISIFFISIKAGGTGLNLTAADYVFILDPWWNPFVEKQAVARAHRIGRVNNVVVTRFISKDSIEEKIIKLQERKKIISNDIMEMNEFENFSSEDLTSLLD